MTPSYWHVDTPAEAAIVESGDIPCDRPPFHRSHSYPGDLVLLHATNTLYRIDSAHKLKKV
jgi:hypothetical protein